METITTKNGIKVYVKVGWYFGNIFLFETVGRAGTIKYDKKHKEYRFVIDPWVKGLSSKTMREVLDKIDELKEKHPEILEHPEL